MSLIEGVPHLCAAAIAHGGLPAPLLLREVPGENKVQCLGWKSKVWMEKKNHSDLHTWLLLPLAPFLTPSPASSGSSFSSGSFLVCTPAWGQAVLLGLEGTCSRAHSSGWCLFVWFSSPVVHLEVEVQGGAPPGRAHLDDPVAEVALCCVVPTQGGEVGPGHRPGHSSTPGRTLVPTSPNHEKNAS